ncbi:MAG: hypothetical protein TREMPRED_005199 [Tremellales sp. Tagirdzhanova-0007]|nr:MAG: hypothetical protein TREMPRED_005199 [Tremellales sp. Tagirdzhanova-0007]
MSHIADSSHDAPTLFHHPRQFKTTEQSNKCLESRNIFFGCLDKNNVEIPPEYDPVQKRVVARGHKDKTMCHEGREEFEKVCPRDWT